MCMELFTIERYEGDSYSAEDNTEKECKSLAQLLEQARGRKRSRELCSKNKQEDNGTASQSSREGAFVLEASSKVKKNEKKKKDKRVKLKRKSINLEQSAENVNEGDYESHALNILEEGQYIIAICIIYFQEIFLINIFTSSLVCIWCSQIGRCTIF